MLQNVSDKVILNLNKLLKFLQQSEGGSFKLDTSR